MEIKILELKPWTTKRKYYYLTGNVTQEMTSEDGEFMIR